jgi:putative phosphonate transport system ATP-binding protein
MALPLLQVQWLTKRYGPRIGCADVSFDLWPGEVLGIVAKAGRANRRCCPAWLECWHR